MKFLWSTLNVKNLDESIEFYSEILNLKVTRKFEAGNGTSIAFLGDGETQIELISSNNSDISIGEDISWGFEVDSLEDTIEFLKKKI